MNSICIIVLYALTVLLFMPITSAMSDQLKDFQRAFDAAKYELQGIKSTFGVEDEKLLRERRRSIDELLANFQTDLNLANEAENIDDGNGGETDDDNANTDTVADGSAISDYSNAAYRGKNCQNGRCESNWNGKFLQNNAAAPRLAPPALEGGRTGKQKKRIDLSKELNEVAKLNPKYKNPRRPYRPMYGPSGVFNFNDKKGMVAEYNPLLSGYSTTYNVTRANDNFKDGETNNYRNNNNNNMRSHNNNGYYRNNNNNNKNRMNNNNNNNYNGNSNNRNNNNNYNNNNDNYNNNNNNNNHYNNHNNYDESNNRNNNGNLYDNKDNSNDNSNNNDNSNSNYNSNDNNNNNNDRDNKNNNDNSYSSLDSTENDNKDSAFKHLKIYSNNPTTGNSNNNKYNSNHNHNDNSNNDNTNSNDYCDSTDSDTKIDDGNRNNEYNNNNNKNNNNKNSDSSTSDYLKSILVSPTIYDSLKSKKTIETPNIVDLLPPTTYDQTIAHVAFPTIDEKHFSLNSNPLISNDQTDISKNDLSHEANYKLSKIEQDAAEACKSYKNWDSWKIKNLALTKRNTFNPLSEIKLKTSSRLMEKGYGASLPSATLEDMQRERKLDDILRRLEFKESKSDGTIYSDLNKWNTLLAKELDDDQETLIHGYDVSPSPLTSKISGDTTTDFQTSLHQNKWEPLLSRIGDDDEYYGLIKARLKRLIDLHNANAQSTTADAAESTNAESEEASKGTTRTKRISDSLDPKVVNAILQLQKDVIRGSRLKRFITNELNNEKVVKSADKKPSPEIKAADTSKEPMLSIMAKDFINDKVLNEEKNDEKTKAAGDAQNVENMMAPAVNNNQEQTKNTIERNSEKENENKENSGNAKTSVAMEGGNSKRSKRSVEASPEKSLKLLTDTLSKSNATNVLRNNVNEITDQKVSLENRIRNTDKREEKSQKPKNHKRTKRSIHIADEVFYDRLNLDLESDDSPIHKRQKRDLNSKDSQQSITKEVPIEIKNRTRHKRTKRSVIDILPLFAVKNTTNSVGILKVGIHNDTINEKTNNTTTHKLQKRATNLDDIYEDHKNNMVRTYTMPDSEKTIGDEDDFDNILAHGKRSHIGLKKNKHFNFEDVTHGSYSQPQQFDNLKEKDPSYSKLDGVKFDNMWYENSNNKINDFRNLLMENRLNNNVRYHSKLNENVNDKGHLHGHNLTAATLTSSSHHDAEVEHKIEPTLNETAEAASTDIGANQVDISVTKETGKANATSSPLVINEADRNLILQLRDQVLNCSAFAQLESMLKTFDGHATNAPAIGGVSQLSGNKSLENPLPEEHAGITNNKQTTTTIAFTPSAAQPTPEEAPATASAPALAPAVPHTKSMSVTMSFDKKGNLMATANQKKPDDASNQPKTAQGQSDTGTPNLAGDSSTKDDMVKLNITISANVIGDQKSNNFYGNGTINVQPGAEDRNRRNVVFPDLGTYDRYEQFDEYEDPIHDEKHGTKRHKHSKKKHKHKSGSKCKPKNKESKKKGKGKANSKDVQKQKKLKPATKTTQAESKGETTCTNHPGIENVASGKLSSKVVQSVFSMVNSNPRLRPLLAALEKPLPQTKQNLENFSAIKNKKTESRIACAEKLIQSAMTSLSAVVDEEMRSRTCIPLRPDLAVFYEQILRSYSDQERYRLKRDATKRSLATDFSKEVRAIDGNKIEERSRIVKKLLKQYEDLPQQDQQQVNGLRDDLLMDLVYLRKIKQSQDMQERRKREVVKQEEMQAKKIDADIMKKLEKDYSPSFLKLLKTAELFKEAAVDSEVV